MTRIKISIVIPTVPQNWRLLSKCMTSIAVNRNPFYDHEYIIAMNDWEGFSIPVNRGIKAATGDYVLIANDDTVVLDRGWESKMIDLMSDKVGIVGHYRSAQHGKFSAMWWTLVRKDVFEKIGLLDENMNIFSQDIDFGYRAMKEGIETAFVDVPVVHHTSSTTSKLDDQEKLKKEAKEIFEKKWGVDHDTV